MTKLGGCCEWREREREREKGLKVVNGAVKDDGPATGVNDAVVSMLLSLSRPRGRNQMKSTVICFAPSHWLSRRLIKYAPPSPSPHPIAGTPVPTRTVSRRADDWFDVNRSLCDLINIRRTPPNRSSYSLDVSQVIAYNRHWGCCYNCCGLSFVMAWMRFCCVVLLDGFVQNFKTSPRHQSMISSPECSQFVYTSRRRQG